MANIFDYIKSHKSNTFKQLEINEVDALILSRLSYFDFTDYIGMTLGEIAKKYTFKDEYKKSKMLLKALGKAKRYSDIKVLDCTILAEDGIRFLFSACTLEFTDSSCFIAFAGTIKNVSSFYEDFSMAYCYPITSQKIALNYLESAVEKHNDKSFFIGGHSKGGSMALYSFLYSNEKTKKQIEQIWNFDGPGLQEDLGDSLSKIDASKVHMIVPKDSIVGRIYTDDLNYEIIKSESFMIYQHNPFRWKIEDKRFVEMDRFNITSKLASNVFIAITKEIDKRKLKKMGEAICCKAEKADIKYNDNFRFAFVKLLSLAKRKLSITKYVK